MRLATDGVTGQHTRVRSQTRSSSADVCVSKGKGTTACAAAPGQDPPTANTSAIGHWNGGTHACDGVHLTSAAARTPAAARWAASSYGVAGTPTTAGSVDNARDFLALNGLAPEPFRQAGNERSLT